MAIEFVYLEKFWKDAFVFSFEVVKIHFRHFLTIFGCCFRFSYFCDVTTNGVTMTKSTLSVTKRTWSVTKKTWSVTKMICDENRLIYVRDLKPEM